METMTAKRSNHGANVKRWREWRGIKQEVLAEEIGVSQSTFSSYEKKDQLEPEIIGKIAKALDIPEEAITEMDEARSINIYSGTWHDQATAGQATAGYGHSFNQSFNPIDKIVELYERLLEAEKQKVTMLQEILNDKK